MGDDDDDDDDAQSGQERQTARSVGEEWDNHQEWLMLLLLPMHSVTGVEGAV